MRILPIPVVLLLVGCAATPRAQADSPDEPAASTPPGPLRDARERRDAAAQLSPPSLPRGATPPAVLSFMKESVTPWVQARRAAVDACVDAFRSASTAAAPRERASPMLEASKAALAFLDAYGRVADAISSALATDPAMKSELLAAFRESEGPHIAMARKVLEECIASDEPGTTPSDAAEQCKTLLPRTSETVASPRK